MKILLIQHRQIGDVLMCTPAVRALRRARPDADITFMVEPFSANALKYNPHINRLITPPKKLGLRAFITLHWKAWRAGYDVVIDFFRNPKSAWITWCSRAPQRIAFSDRFRRFAYTMPVEAGSPDDYAAVQKLRLLKPLGIDAETDCLPEFFITGEERAWADRLWDQLGFAPGDLVITVSPVSRKQYRVWPAEYYAALCDHLVSTHGARVLLTWGPGEEHFIEPIVQGMKHTPATDYPMPSLLQLQGLLAKSSLVIANNNGPRHMAIAAGTPTLGLFSKLSPTHWTPPCRPEHVFVQPDPVRDEEDREVLRAENLPVDKAVQAADELIRRIKTGGQRSEVRA